MAKGIIYFRFKWSYAERIVLYYFYRGWKDPDVKRIKKKWKSKVNIFVLFRHLCFILLLFLPLVILVVKSNDLNCQWIFLHGVRCVQWINCCQLWMNISYGIIDCISIWRCVEINTHFFSSVLTPIRPLVPFECYCFCFKSIFEQKEKKTHVKIEKLLKMERKSRQE